MAKMSIDKGFCYNKFNNLPSHKKNTHNPL
jgi:hypothetical protein